jgi:5-methylcytosine-specific restriction endonuclease McrA
VVENVSRKEFSAKTRKFAIEAATDKDGITWCAICELPIRGGAECDHITPDAFACDLLGYEINDIRNCQVLCVKCHKAKTKQDVKAISKADRIRKKHLGIIRPNSKLAKRNRWNP